MLKLLQISFCFALLLLMHPNARGQSASDVQDMRGAVGYNTEYLKGHEGAVLGNNHRSQGTWLLKFYKNFISSQDGNNCNFYPSCSLYALKSINRYGLIFGTLSAFDRLSRCNGSQPEYYTHHHATDGRLLLYDPVR